MEMHSPFVSHSSGLWRSHGSGGINIMPHLIDFTYISLLYKRTSKEAPVDAT